MHLQSNTFAILKNFASINTNLVIKQGKKISTISPTDDIIAEYEGDDEFSTDVAVYNLNELLGVLGAFENPELVLSNKLMTIKQGKQKVNYTYAEASLLKSPPTKGITFPAAGISFVLTDVMLSKIQKMGSILGVDDLSIIGDGKNIIMKIFDKTHSSSNEFEIDMELATTEVFQINMKIDRLKLFQGSYTVDITTGKGLKISRFKHVDMPLMYYIAVESDSTVG